MTDAYRIVFHCLDQNQKLLAEQVTFSFIGTWFGIDPTSNLVHYLKITIDTVEALSLLHLFLWQHRQGLMLRSNIQLIIIQDELEASNTAVTEYWRNLASLSLQMGFSTVSFISYSDIGYYKPTNQIIIVSQLLRIDTQQLDTMAGLSQFRFDGKMSTLMKSIVLQRIGLTVHEERKYAHLLPMILGYSAYLIYEEMEKQGVIQRYVTAQVDAIYEVSYSQQVYTDLIIPDSFKNFFELPVHLLKIFGFDDTNKFIFQQMCDVSYLFKAQYFAVFSAFFPLDNAVLSQSSRSGKTVTLHTIFYFNLFSGIKIPILINTGFTKDSRELETQPLYDRTSIEIGEGIRALFCEYQSKTDLGDVISSNLKDGVEYSKTMAYVKAECFNLIKTYDMHTAQQQLKGAFELYLQGTSVFCEFSVTGLLDFLI
uniref:Uncharacterized protein n=1 Tax=Spironucleus salmonicida TaxID=348837 RepID=V6LTN3_9EUKA|eukprot:EST47056.1 Hypothetical protein SS50377_12903 [Spironucleus salmonicida]